MIMKNLCLRSELYLAWPSASNAPSNPPLFVKPIQAVVSHSHSHGKQLKHPPSKVLRHKTPVTLNLKHTTASLLLHEKGHTRLVIMGAVSVGILVLLSGMDPQKALALGPQGPLVEEFWDNVRRYALYALTVSTGAIYTIFQPIFDLLKNPVSAILVLAIFGATIYLLSQVLSAMVGVTDFTYDYGY